MNIATTDNIKFLDKVNGRVEAIYAGRASGKPKDPITLHEDFVEMATLDAADMAANIDTKDKTNIYSAPPMDTLVASIGSIPEDVFYKEILAPMGMSEVDPAKIFDAGVAGIRSGKVTAEQVIVGIEKIGDGIAAYNNVIKDGGFSKVGLPSQDTYNTTIPRPLSNIESILETASVSGKTVLGALAVGISSSAIKTEKAAKLLSETAGAFSREIPVDIMNPSAVKSALTTLLSFTSKPAELAAPAPKAPVQD